MRDLFDDDPDAVLHEYLGTFAAWLTDMRRRGKLAAGGAFDVYEDMWIALARHMAEREPPVPVQCLDVSHLESFIGARSGRHSDAPSPRYVWRLLHLIDRVLGHGARQKGRASTSAAMDLLATRKEWLHANARGREALPDYLSPTQARRLVKHLVRVRAQIGRAGQLVGWHDVRTSASIAVQLGAGLTPAEVRELTVAAPIADGGGLAGIPWKIRVPIVSTARGREAPLALWAGHIVKRWLGIRDELAIPGPWLFPSTRTKGTQWGKIGHYEATRALLMAAGWSENEAKGGSFRLRHTFALRQLQRGAEEAQVAKWLGIDQEAMRKYRNVLYEPVWDLD